MVLVTNYETEKYAQPYRSPPLLPPLPHSLCVSSPPADQIEARVPGTLQLLRRVCRRWALITPVCGGASLRVAPHTN